MAAKLRESAAASPVESSSVQTANDSAPYCADDLAFAASYAKDLSNQIKKPEWDT